MTVMACFEAPGYGGAATANYQRFADLQQRGLKVSWINLLPAEQLSFLMSTFGSQLGNPWNLPDVHNCRIEFPPFHHQPALGQLLQRLAPSALVGCGYIAAWLLQRMAPRVPLTFLTAGFRWAQDLVGTEQFPDLVSLQRHLSWHGPAGLPPLHRRQQEAFLACQRCLTHADMIADLYRCFFPEQIHKIDPHIFWQAGLAFDEARDFLELARPFHQRDLDLLFVASRWDRPEKCFPMVVDIAAACPQLRVGLVGVCDQPPTGCQAFGLIAERQRLWELLGRSRVLVCPSRFDAAPGILYEGAAMGCNLVASPNCGNWSMLHPELLVHRFCAEDFVRRCQLAVAKPYPDQRQLLLAQNSQELLYDRLSSSANSIL